MPTVLISAGDASGDAHAAGLARAVADRRPDVRLVGLGGEALRKAGVELVADQAALAIGGLVELTGGVGGIVRAWRRVTAALDAHRPDLVVLVDSGGFNLPLARRVRRTTDARVLYYVAPQVWAWRRGRLRKIARRVDRVAVIHPFEADVYRAAGIAAEFVGHPLVDDLASLRTRFGRSDACALAGLDPRRRWVALLPGSRRNEVDRHLPVALETARRLHARAPGLGFALALAPSVDPERVEACVRAAALPAALPLAVVCDRTREVLIASELALAKPGTVTVEAMLLGCPMVVFGRAHPITAAVVRRMVSVPWLGMPNLIAGAAIVPELLQQQATPERLADAVESLLDREAAATQRRTLADAAARLGGGGAAARVGAIVEQMLDGPPT